MCQTLDFAELNSPAKERRLQPSLISATIYAAFSGVTDIFRREKTHQTSKNTQQNIVPHDHICIQSQKQKKTYSFTHNGDELSGCCIVVFASYEVLLPSYRFLTAQTCTVHSFLSVLVGMRVGNIILFILAFVLPFPERWRMYFAMRFSFYLCAKTFVVQCISELNSFESPSSTLGGDRHMCSRTFMGKIQSQRIFILNFFSCDAYFDSFEP